MSLEGAKFICLDEAGNHGDIVLAKGRKFTMGYYMSCDFILVDERAKGVHCEIECDAFGRVTIRNLSPDKPILVNGSTVEIKRILLNNSKLSILDKEYLWIFPKISSNEFEDLPVEAASTPQKQIGIPEQPPNSCPDFKFHREIPKRFTVHNFAYCIQSDEEGNTSSDSNDENTNIQDTQTNQTQNELKTQIKRDTTAGSTENITQAKDVENRNRSVTPEPKDQNEKSTGALKETPKSNLINCTKDKENKSTEKKKNKQLLTMCNQSDVVITSFSPRETGVRIEKSFATVVKPKVQVTPATPKSVYSTPKSVLNEKERDEEDEERSLMTFYTPSTSKKVTTGATTSKVFKNSSMHLIDLTTPNKLRPASSYLMSALKASTKKNNTQTAAVDKAGSKLSAEEQLGLSTLPSTPMLADASNSPLETPSSVISVSSSTDTSSIIEVTSDGSNMGITPGSATGLNTPIKTENRAGACTPKRTPQSLMKRALLTSAKKQNITPQISANTNTATTPRRESINRIPLRSNLALLRTPVTPQASTGDKRSFQLPRRQSLSTPTRKSMSGRSRFDMSPSTSNLASSPSTSKKMATRRSSINPISAARALPTSTPVSASRNNSGLKTRAACKTSPLHKVRKSIGGIPLSSHISKARKSIVLPASTSKITSIKEKSPQQVMSDRLVTRARKFLCLTPTSASSAIMVTAAKTPPQQSCPSSILKARTTQSARKPERKAVLFADKQPAVSGGVDNLSRTFIVDSDEEEKTEKQEEKPKDATFSPAKESKETEKLTDDKNEAAKEQEPIEIPVDVEEIIGLHVKNKESDHEKYIKTSNDLQISTAEEKNIEEEIVVSEIEVVNVGKNVPKSISNVTEESFAEIITDSQKTNKENIGKIRLTDTIDITDSPKETSKTESQESFADDLGEIGGANIKETETNATEGSVETITQYKNEILETGFGEESIVENIETSISENTPNKGAKNEEETTRNTENNNKTELKQKKEFNNQRLTENKTEELKNSLEMVNVSSEEVVECETINKEKESFSVHEVEDKVQLKVDETKSYEYKPIVEDITLEGSLLEKETKENEDTNVSKQPFCEDITLETSLIEEKNKSEEIKNEITKSNVSKILQTSENSEEQHGHISKTEDMTNIYQKQITSHVQETTNVYDAKSDKNVLELSETNKVNKDTFEKNLDENIESSEIMEDELPTTKSEVQSSTLFKEEIDNDNTSKLLEEIENVLNKSDKIKEQHLMELEEGNQETEKPLTEEFESEKLSQEITENKKETTLSGIEVTNEPVDNISSGDKIQESSDAETSQQDFRSQVQEGQKYNECEQVTKTSSQEETSKSTETIHAETENNTLTYEIQNLTLDLETEILLKSQENIECKVEDTQSPESNVTQPPEHDVSKEEKALENTKIKEMEIGASNVEHTRELEAKAQSSERNVSQTENYTSKMEKVEELCSSQEQAETQETEVDASNVKNTKELEAKTTEDIEELTSHQSDEATTSETIDSNSTPSETKTELCTQESSDVPEINVINEENVKEVQTNESDIDKKEKNADGSLNQSQNTQSLETEELEKKTSIGGNIELFAQKKSEENAKKLEAKESESIQNEENDEHLESSESEIIQKEKKTEIEIFESEQNVQEQSALSHNQDTKFFNETVNINDSESAVISDQKEAETLLQKVGDQSVVTKSCDMTVNDTISHSDTDSKQNIPENNSNLQLTVESEEIISEIKKSKELLTISIKKKIENASSFTPRRTRRTSQSAETSQNSATELSFTPRRSTRRASQSAETSQTTTTDLSLTPRRSTRRASMSAESTTLTATPTPTKRTTRRASLSLVSETPLTPKAINKRRASISLDDETAKTITSKTPRKQLEQRMVIPEELEEVPDTVIIEEEEEPAQEAAQSEKKKNEKKLRSSISCDNATPEPNTSTRPTAKTPLNQWQQSVVVTERIDEVISAIIEKEEEPNLEIEDNEEKKNEKKSLRKDSKDTLQCKEEATEPADSAEETSTTDVKNLAEELPAAGEVLEIQDTTEKIVLDSEEKAENIENDNTAKFDDILPSDEKEVTAVVNTLEKEVNLLSEENQQGKKEVSDVIVSEEEQSAVNTFEKEVATKEISEKEVVDATNNISSQEKEVVSLIAPDIAIETHEEFSDDIMEQLIVGSDREDEVEQVAAKDTSTIDKTSEEQDRNAKAIETYAEKDSSETDLNSSKTSADDSKVEEIENLKFVSDVEKTPTRATTTSAKKSLKIVADSPKTPSLAGMRELLKTPKAETQTPRLGGIRDLVRTPKDTPECEEDINEKLLAVADLLKTPKAAKATIEMSTPKAKKHVTIIADSPKTPIMTGMRELLKTPKAETNTPKLVGIRNLVRTPKSKIENEQEESETLAVVAELVKTPQASTFTEEMPSTSLKDHNLKGVKELLKTPQSCNTPRLRGIRELMQTPKTSLTPVIAGVKQLLESPVPQGNVSEIIVENAKTTSKNVVNLKDFKELLKTPKRCSTPRLKGVRELMQTPKMSSTPIMGGIKELMASPTAHQKDHELEKFLRTPSAKNIMIPTMPSSAVIEKSCDSIEISTEYNLNVTHDGETANLEELFKTPVASRFVERITASHYGEEGEEDDETVEIFNKTTNESLHDTLNKSAEEAFDKLIGQETQIQTPISKTYKRKSFALQTPQAQSPFTAADVLSDLPKSDVQEWIENLDLEPPTILECDDDNEDVVEHDIVTENEEASGLEYTWSEKNISANDSVIPETLTKVYLKEKSLTNVATAYLSNTETKDPLLSTTAKPKEKLTRPLTPIEAEISGINLLDQTVESVHDEPSMLDEPLFVEEPSMFEEPLMVSDNEPDEDDTLNNDDAVEISHYEDNDLSEPLLLSDSDDFNQSQEIQTNVLDIKSDENELLHTSNIEVNVEEKSMLAKVSDQSLTEDPLETKDKGLEASIIENTSIIDIKAIKIEDESNKKGTSKEDELPAYTYVTESLTEYQSLLIEDSSIKKSSQISVQTEAKNNETEEETLKHSENQLDAEVDAAETTVENVKDAIEKMVEVNNENSDAKEILIKETKVKSNSPEDIFLDISVTEIFEVTNELVETKKLSPKEINQELDHECQDIFMDNSNIDESFADEANNEENDVENESAMVEVTTKEVTKDQSEEVSSTVEAANDDETAKENEKEVEKETENNSENVGISKAEQKENVKVVEESADFSKHVEETASLELNTTLSEIELTHTITIETKEKESEKSEVTADVAGEPSFSICGELERSQIKDTVEEHMVMTELPAEIKAKPSYTSVTPTSETSVIEQESSDDKLAESKLIETLDIEQGSSDEKQISEESAVRINDIKLSETPEEQVITDIFTERSTEQEEELKQSSAAIPSKVLVKETNENVNQDSSSAGEILTEDKVTSEVPQSAVEIINETKSIVECESQDNEASAVEKEETIAETTSQTHKELPNKFKDSQSSEVITDNPEPNTTEHLKPSIEIKVTIDTISQTLEEIESEEPSETALIEASVSKQEHIHSTVETSQTLTESQKNNKSQKSKDSSKTIETNTKEKLVSKHDEISEDKEYLTISEETHQPVKETNNVEEENSNIDNIIAISSLTEEKVLLNSDEEVSSTKEEVAKKSDICEEKSASITTPQKLQKSTFKITEPSEVSIKPLEITKSYDFEIKIQDTDHHNQKETVMKTSDDKTEKPAISLRKRKCSQTTETSNAVSALPTNRRARRNTKTEEEDNTSEITALTEKDYQKLTKHNAVKTSQETETVNEPLIEKQDLEKAVETALEYKEAVKVAAKEVLEVSEDSEVKETQVITIKTGCKKRTLSESSQDSIQGEESHYRSLRDKRKVNKKQPKDKLREVEEEFIEQQEISKQDVVNEEVQLKRIRTTSESSQGSVKNDEHHSSTRRGRRKVQKAPIEKTVIEQNEESINLAAEQVGDLKQPKEQMKETKKQMKEQNLNVPKECTNKIYNDVEPEELIVEEDEGLVEISTEKLAAVTPKEEQIEETEVHAIKVENDATATEEKLNFELPKAETDIKEEIKEPSADTPKEESETREVVDDTFNVHKESAAEIPDSNIVEERKAKDDQTKKHKQVKLPIKPTTSSALPEQQNLDILNKNVAETRLEETLPTSLNEEKNLKETQTNKRSVKAILSDATELQKNKLEVIEMPELEEVTQTVQEHNDVVAITLEETKEQTVKRGRRKHTLSESSQGSIHEEDNTRSRKTRRKVQKIPVEEVVVEEVVDSEEVITIATSTTTSEILTTENEKDLVIKEAEIESTLSVAMQQEKPTDCKLAHEQAVEVQSATLEEVKERTIKRARRKPTISESSQGSVNEDDSLRTRKGRRKVQKIPVEEFVLEENEEQQTNQLEEKPVEIEGEKEEVPDKSDFNQRTKESFNDNSENVAKSVVIDIQEDVAEDFTKSKQDLGHDKVVMESFDNQDQTSDSKDTEEHSQELPEMVVVEKKDTQEHEGAKQHGVKRGRRKHDLTENLPEQPTISRKGRRKVPVSATEVAVIKTIKEHKNLPVAAEIDLSENKSPEIQGIKFIETEEVQAVNLTEVSSIEIIEEKQETIDNLPEIKSTQVKHDAECNEDSAKQQEYQQDDTSSKQTAKRGGRRKVDVEVIVETSAVVDEITTAHTTKRGGRHKAAASTETTASEISNVRHTSRNRKTPVEHSLASETVLTEVNEEIQIEKVEMPTTKTGDHKGRTASRNRKTPEEHPMSSTHQEERTKAIKVVEEMPTVVETPKARTASRNRKKSVDHQTTLTQQENQIESTKVVKEVLTVPEVSKGRTIRNRKTPIEQATTVKEELSVDNEKPIESSKEIVVISSEIEKTETADLVNLGDSKDEEKHQAEMDDKSLKKRVKRSRTASETNQGSVVDEKPTKKRARHQVAETEETQAADAKTIELKKEENIEEVQTNKEMAEKPQKSTRRRGAAAKHEDHDEHQEQTSTKSRRRRARHEEAEEHQHVENMDDPKKPTEGVLLSEAQITEVNLEHEELLDQHITPLEENLKVVKVRKGRRKAADEELQHQEEHETLAATKRRAVAKHIEHDHEESGTSSKRRVGRRHQATDKHETEEKVSAVPTENSETVSKRRNIGKRQQEHEKEEDHHDAKASKEPILSENRESTSTQRSVDKKKHDHEHEHDYHVVETQHPQEEARKGKGRRKKNDHSEESEQPTTSHSPETKQKGRRRKESQTGSQEHDANEKEHNDEKLTKEPKTKLDNTSAELQTPQRAAPIARRGRKASTIEHITAESHELDDTPGRRARNVPQRRAATAYHNYDETSDSDVATKIKKKTDSPRKSIEASKSSPTATVTSAPIINPSPAPSTTASATTARGRTRKPTAKVQQLLEEERAKAETPKRRGLLAAAAAAVTDTATPQRTPARRGRKASTIDTDIDGTPQASKGRGRGKNTAQTKEDHSVIVPETTSIVEVKEIELHTTPPPAQPAKGRRGGRKAKIIEEEHQKGDEPPAKKSPLQLESEKQDSSPPADAPTPPTRVAGRRNAAAAAKARIEEDALAAAAVDPPKRARAKRTPAKFATPVVATTDTDAQSSELEEEKGVKNKNSPQKRDHRLASASTTQGAEDLEDEAETMYKSANKKVRKTPTATTTDSTAAVPAKRSRKAKPVEEVADAETPGESKTTRGRGRGRKNVHFGEHQEAVATTSTNIQKNTPNIEPTAVETPEPIKRGTRTRRK